MVILSISRSKGNYQGADYDNIVFQCFSDYASKSLLAGTPVESLKIKSDTVVDCLGKSLSSIDWEGLIGSEILPQYNKFGQAVSFVISPVSSEATETSKAASDISTSKASSKK